MGYTQNLRFVGGDLGFILLGTGGKLPISCLTIRTEIDTNQPMTTVETPYGTLTGDFRYNAPLPDLEWTIPYAEMEFVPGLLPNGNKAYLWFRAH